MQSYISKQPGAPGEWDNLLPSMLGAKPLWTVPNMFAYVQACLDRRVYPLCLLPGLFPQLGLVLTMRETTKGPTAQVLCLSTGQLHEHDPSLLDPYNPDVAWP